MYLKFCKLDEQIAWTSERSGVVHLLKRPNQRLPESLAAGLRARRRGGAAARGTEFDDVAHRRRGATRERLERSTGLVPGGAIGTRDVPTRCQCTPRVRSFRSRVWCPRSACVPIRSPTRCLLPGPPPACARPRIGLRCPCRQRGQSCARMRPKLAFLSTSPRPLLLDLAHAQIAGRDSVDGGSSPFPLRPCRISSPPLLQWANDLASFSLLQSDSLHKHIIG